MLEITKNLISVNFSKGVTIVPQWIAIHETDNVNVGADAMANRNYFQNHPEAEVSAHFTVDDHSIVQCLELNQRGWHVGVRYGIPSVPQATNSNTIGIEICVNADGDYMKARQNAIDLARYLMGVLNLGVDRVIRHYDACVKYCPRRMMDNPSLWADFINQLKGITTSEPAPKPIVNTGVLSLQKALNQLKFVGSNGQRLTEDGVSGTNTQFAVKAFQTVAGLSVDGVAGTNTWSAINSILAKPLCKVTSKGIPVRYIQYRVGASIDGVFGNGTKASVANWQGKNGLTADGVVGNMSWAKLLG